MNYPRYDVYAKIYARYLIKAPVQFMEHIDQLPADSNVLDLCGGGGLLTMYAHDRDMVVDYVDQERDMIPVEIFGDHTRINIFSMPINQFIPRAHDMHFLKRYDLVMCRQAVNYWMKCTNIGPLAELIKTGGKFIFNTFSTKPSEKPTVKQYEVDGVSYVETYYLVGTRLHHIQVCEGYPPHVTEFDWISTDEFVSMLQPHFDIDLTIKGASSFYVCTRKP